MYQTLWIPGRLPGLNEVINQNRGNKFAGAKTKKKLTNDIAVLAKAQLKPCSEGCKITFIWFEPNRKRDPDNIASAKKFILDGLVKAGILENDGWKQVKWFVDFFEVEKSNPGVRVKLAEIL